ncbi:MAG: translesion DNA synthesis-associated protein ImuA [Candidatus Aquirickettsiella gammari]
MFSATSPHQSTNLENLHPSLWRASQLGRGFGEYLDCGHPSLANELPGAGWPLANLTELLVQQAGSAELQLLSPALAQLREGQIILLNTPYQPQILALSALRLDLSRVLWLPCSKPQDALWAAEQIVKNQACAALLLWQPMRQNFKSDALRRLHLAAQSGRSLFCLIRPWESQLSPSPAPLRLKLALDNTGLQIEVFKRRGAQQAKPIVLPFNDLVPQFLLPAHQHQPSTRHHAKLDSSFVDSHLPAATRAGGISSALVE